MEAGSRNWVDYINLCKENQETGMRPFAIQFANCERIAANDAVFLFDEVGSGKTVSTGLMAMECLERSGGDVLVITVPQLARPLEGHPKGQFYGDWEDKLGNVIRMKGWESRIHVINNHYSNIQKHICDGKYALVILDEAHLFLKASSSPEYEKQMLQELYRIKTEKVVLATATPIKYGSGDLREYVEIAQEMLCGTEDDPVRENDEFRQRVDACYRKLCDHLIPTEKKEVICSVFDPACLVTRYFKDTIRRFTEKEYTQAKVCRAGAEIWEMTADNRKPEKEQLIDKIIEKRDGKNRFVIFTRYRKDAYELKDICTKKEICAEAVTGENSAKLGLYSGVKEKEEEGPEVLILTDRLAEQGVNLPMYNYVVNYYISPFPANLEQRFGRVDRLNSEHEFIHMCYWMNYNNQTNFYCAFAEYVHDLLAAVPSRNVLLTEEIFDLLLQRSEELESLRQHRIKLLEEKCKDYAACADELMRCRNQGAEKSEDTEYLLDLCAEVVADDQDISLEELADIFQKEMERLRKMGTVKLKESEKEYLKKISRLGNKIFYVQGTRERSNEVWDIASDMNTLSPSDDCVNAIENCDAYKAYREAFRRRIEVPLKLRQMHEDYDGEINRYFIDCCEENQLNKVFPYEEGEAFYAISPEKKNRFYTEVLKEIVSEEDRKLFEDEEQLAYVFLADNTLFLAGKTMLETLNKNITNRCGAYYKRFRFDPIDQTFADLGIHVPIISEANGKVRLHPYIKLLLVMAGYKIIRGILFTDSGKRRSGISDFWYIKTNLKPDDIWTQTWIQCGR